LSPFLFTEGGKLTAEALRKLWKNEHFKTLLTIILIIVVVFGLWFGAQFVLNTPFPILAVASGSMCKPHYMYCDGYSHPFERTLHIGDLIIVQGISAKDVKTGFDPNGDIIVFHRPKSVSSDPDELIVHRAIANVTKNGLIYFRTRGDGSQSSSGDQWNRDYRDGNTYENYTLDGMVSEKMLVGRVVMRVPWLGHIALFMRNSSGIYIILALLIILIIVEFALPMLRKKTPEKEPEVSTEETREKPPET
jgi:signal peptidase I